jgi:hypothetical protein
MFSKVQPFSMFWIIFCIHGMCKSAIFSVASMVLLEVSRPLHSVKQYLLVGILALSGVTRALNVRQVWHHNVTDICVHCSDVLVTLGFRPVIPSKMIS